MASPRFCDFFMLPRGRDAPFGAPPAQIPACSFPAPGSSLLLTSSHGTCVRHAPSLFWGYRLHGFSAILCRPCRHSPRRNSAVPFPLCAAFPRSEYYATVGLLCTPLLGSMSLPLHTLARAREVQGPPTFSACLSSHATLSDPGGCPVLSPRRSFNPSAFRAREAVFCRPGRCELPVR